MDKNVKRAIYWTPTIIMCGIFAFSATMYFTKTEMVRGFFDALHYPTNLVYPLAIAKILGIIAIISNKSRILSEWAYAGFFFDAVLATLAHYTAGHGLFGMSAAAIIVVVLSRVFWSYRTAS